MTTHASAFFAPGLFKGRVVAVKHLSRGPCSFVVNWHITAVSNRRVEWQILQAADNQSLPTGIVERLHLGRLPLIRFWIDLRRSSMSAFSQPSIGIP